MELKRLSKSFKKGEFALSEIDFMLQRGEIVGLVGPNGAGKTTLMKVLSGLIVTYDGEFVHDSVKVGSLIEKPKFFPSKSGAYNIKYFCALNGASTKQVDEVVQSLGMAPYLKKKVKHYSLGMKQRLGIALALVSNPDYLILDEPTNGMDPDGIRNILSYLKRLVEERNIGLLISSHILEDVENISDRVYVIKNGAIISEYTGKQVERILSITLSNQDRQKAVAILSQRWDVTHNGAEVSVLSEDVKSVLKELAEEGIYPENVEKKQATLEDFYFEQMESEAT
ncbi:ABC transporter ATP-binding protein [Alkalihalobacillus sp. CinArs1]|uniref:ABC transporter ATP-binding protein n=1 Tax=Alkalihalobacillus sp. CinArs1 TaxID=2995314 RepID=UPI0022DD97C6|nr:ABC transporter ATP-binding protein [Alkalihalobacillus sp. CinArs1]